MDDREPPLMTPDGPAKVRSLPNWRSRLPRSLTTRTSLVAGAGALVTTILGSIVMVLLNDSIWVAMPQIMALIGVVILSVASRDLGTPRDARTD